MFFKWETKWENRLFTNCQPHIHGINLYILYMYIYVYIYIYNICYTYMHINEVSKPLHERST